MVARPAAVPYILLCALVGSPVQAARLQPVLQSAHEVAGSTDSASCGQRYTYLQCEAAPHRCRWDETHGQCTVLWHVVDAGGGVSAGDVAQGDLASCYFLGVLASIAHRKPHLIEGLFKDTHLWHGARPAYVTQWLMVGRPVRVAVDDYLPFDATTGYPFFASYGSSMQAWPMILEKAWAKIFGSYKSIENGFGVEAFKALTQAPVDILPNPGNGFPASEEDIWARLLQATGAGYPMCAGTGDVTTNGIAAGHVYALLAAEMRAINGTPQRTVRLYNPWAYSKYQGAVPRSVNTGLDNGEFNMLLSEFLTAFGGSTVARVRDGYSVSSVRLAKQKQRMARSFEITLESSDPFSVQLEWPSHRILESEGCDQLDPRIFLEVAGPDNTRRSTSRTELQDWASQSNVRVDLPGLAGTYTVHVFSEFPMGPWLREVVLNTYASERVAFREAGDTVAWPSYVEFQGFDHAFLNARFTETRDTQYAISNLSTFWTDDYEYFLYFCGEYNWRQWVLNGRAYFDGIHDGSAECSGWAAGPTLRDIIDPECGSNWLELNEASSEYEARPSAGVAAIGGQSQAVPQADVGAPGRCLHLLDHFDGLNNWQAIKERPVDPLFPTNLTSIAPPGVSCGDSAHNISNSCEYYNHWGTIFDVFASHTSSSL